MRETFIGRRNLAVTQSYRHGVPDHPDHWTDQELAEWRDSLQAAGKWSAQSERAWDAMLEARSDTFGQFRSVLYSGYAPLPPEVLATAPKGILAEGLYKPNPALPLLSHRIHQAISTLPDGPRPNRAAMDRIIEGLRPGRVYRGVVTRYLKGAELIGGLLILMKDGRMTISLHGRRLREVNCADAQLPALVRLYGLWRRLVRMCVAEALVHALPAAGRTLDDRIQLALPLEHGSPAREVLIPEGKRIRQCVMQVLHGRDMWADWPQRYEFAGRLIDLMRDSRLQIVNAIDRALQDFGTRCPLLQPIDVPAPTRTEIEARIDALSRQNIRALCGDGEVDLVDPRAEQYEVLQDSMTGLYPIGRFKAFALAVDFEYSNRRQITSRLCVGVGGGRLVMTGEARMPAAPGAGRTG